MLKPSFFFLLCITALNLSIHAQNDPYLSQQWSLGTISAPGAWSVSNGGTTADGDEIVVAVFDKGFDLNHEDINYWKNNLESAGNSIDDDNNNYTDDYDGWNAYTQNGIITSDNNNAPHGTPIAGIIGAIGNNSKGITGVNWNVKIMPVQITANSGILDKPALLRAFAYVKHMRELYDQTNGAKGAFIVAVNLSYSYYSQQGLDPAIINGNLDLCDKIDELGSLGILTVVAPHNEHGKVGVTFNDMPTQCSSPYKVSVTNFDQSDDFHFENDNTHCEVGAPWSLTYIDIAAPGTDMFTTLPGNIYGSVDGSGHSISGTSFAAPIVAGAISLVFSAACADFLHNYKNNPSQVILSIKNGLRQKSDITNNIYENYDIVFGLCVLINTDNVTFPRLNLLKYLTPYGESMDENLYLSTTETSDKIYEAINSIVCENYTSMSHNLILNAGQSIELKPGIELEPTSSYTQEISIDENAFQCAIPILPLSVSVSGPSSPYCAYMTPQSFQASVTGGVPPYSYNWCRKPINGGSWTCPGITAPNYNSYVITEDTYVHVTVTDSSGSSITSSDFTLDCWNVRMAGTDSISYLSESIKFTYGPNPAQNGIDFNFFSEESLSLSIHIYSILNQENLIFNKLIELKSGESSYSLNLENLNNGIYFCSVSSGEWKQTFRLVVIK